jgi:hypothetical protein
VFISDLIPGRGRDVPFLHSIKTYSRPNPLPTTGHSGALCRGVKRIVLPPWGAEVKNAWSYISPPQRGANLRRIEFTVDRIMHEIIKRFQIL